MDGIEPDYWSRAVAELNAADSTLARLISLYPGASMRSRGDPFTTLARAITGQQISVKAADSIWRKLMVLTEITPLDVSVQTIVNLRSCGYSQRKVQYLQDLCRHFTEKRIDVEAWPRMEDESIILELTRIRGIGRWSAEMFLMFNLLRPDVFPVDDIGLQKALVLHYPELTSQNKTGWRQHAERWKPWRSVATWYLWRSLDPVAVAY